MKTCKKFRIIIRSIFLEWHKFQTKVVQKINTCILCSVTFFSPKIVPLMSSCGKIWLSQTGHKWQYNTAHALSMVDNWGYRHTLRIHNTVFIAFPAQQWLHERAWIFLFIFRVFHLQLQESGYRLWRSLLCFWHLGSSKPPFLWKADHFWRRAPGVLPMRYQQFEAGRSVLVSWPRYEDVLYTQIATE
jgi:hypothetical protein